MTDPFHTHIRSALGDPNLQAALDANADRRIRVRQEALGTLDNPQDLRRKAHQIRAGVIANLEEYLDQFIRQVKANGIIVHQARNAEEAVAIVLEIAGRHHAHLVAKSKTMVSEEIHLNKALESAGIQTVETDLGEYIVQLRGERPAHIITPAVHLRRADVGRTFHEKLGMPLTDDIPTMTDLARRKLRQVFLTADIGVSGVNMGVVETGALCILTNEGNGRMVTTLPPVHIALMGIERLVTTLDDLAVILQLLPRSATGQKLTVYTSLIHSPRRPGDPDGPQERHLVMVDNGRRTVRQSPLAEALYCIRCGACLNACPVFREIGGHAYIGTHGEETAYPGPIGAVLSPALFGGAEFGSLARASSLCGACREACPVDIDLPGLLLKIRAGKITPQKEIVPEVGMLPTGNIRPAEMKPVRVPFALGLGLRIYTWMATSPTRFALAQRAAGWFSRLISPRQAWIRLPALTGWGLSKDFPRPAIRPFHLEYTPNTPRPEADAAPENLSQVSPSIMEKQEQAQTNLERFKQELEALGGAVTLCREDELAAEVLACLRVRGIQDVLTWERKPAKGGLSGTFLDALEAGGIRLVSTPDPTIRAGLTGAQAGLSETGSILLCGGSGQLLSASLLPEIHLAVLRARDILPRLADVLKLPQVREAAASVLVSGPSRTADIEMTLTIGVHGPKEIHVFCVID